MLIKTISLVTLSLFGQLASAHILFVEPQTLLENPAQAPAEDDFSFATPFLIQNVSDSQAIFSFLTPGDLDVFEFEVTPEDVAFGPLVVSASALPPACQETIDNFPFTALMGPSLPPPPANLPFDVPPGMGVVVAKNPRIEPGNARDIFDLDTAEPEQGLGVSWFLPLGLTQACLFDIPPSCDFSNTIAQPVSVPGTYSIVMFDPTGKAQDYTANIGLGEENLVSKPDIEDLVRDNGLLHKACSPTTGEMFGLSASATTDRSNPSPLANQTLSGDAFVFIDPIFPQVGVNQVDFFLDGSFMKTESFAPYDLKGTPNGIPRRLNTRNLDDGRHKVRAKIRFASGRVQSITEKFFVSNVTPPISTTTIKAVHSDKCMDVNGASNADGANVIQWRCHNGANQEWELVPIGGGIFEIVAMHSGKCLDVSGASTANNTNVLQWRCHGRANQQWELQSLDNDTFQIMAVHSGQCLDVSKASASNGASVIQWPCHGQANQQWKLNPN